MEDFEVSVKSPQIRSYIPLNTSTTSNPSPFEHLLGTTANLIFVVPNSCSDNTSCCLLLRWGLSQEPGRLLAPRLPDFLGVN